MAIIKEETTQLIHRGLSFTTIPNCSVEEIKNTDALSVWVYLMTKPPYWIINKQQIQDHFNIGRDKLEAAIKYLRNLGYIQIKYDREKDGKIKNKQLNLWSIPEVIHRQTPHNPENPCYGSSITLKNHVMVKPCHGKTAPSNTSSISNNNNYSNLPEPVANAPSREKKSVKHKLPDDFMYNEGHEQKAKELGLDLNSELENFKDYHLAHGTLMVDWAAGLRTWLRNAKKFQVIQRQQSSNNSSSGAFNGLPSGKLGYTAWWQNDCRQRLGRWTNSYSLLGEPEELFRKRYQEYLKQA